MHHGLDLRACEGLRRWTMFWIRYGMALGFRSPSPESLRPQKITFRRLRGWRCRDCYLSIMRWSQYGVPPAEVGMSWMPLPCGILGEGRVGELRCALSRRVPRYSLLVWWISNPMQMYCLLLVDSDTGSWTPPGELCVLYCTCRVTVLCLARMHAVCITRPSEIVETTGSVSVYCTVHAW